MKNVSQNNMEFPSGVYHYRWDCPEQRTSWKNNSNVCDHCVCYVCNVCMRHGCRVHSHRFAAPPEIAQWQEERGCPDVLVSPVSTQELNEEGQILLFECSIDNISIGSNIVEICGIPKQMFLTYMSKFVTNDVWPILVQMGLYRMTQGVEGDAITKFHALQHTCAHARLNLPKIGKLQWPDRVPDDAFATLLRLRKKPGYPVYTLDARVYSGANRTIFCSPMERVLSMASMGPLTVPDVTEAPPSDREMFPHQIRSLARMEYIEEHGLTHSLWNRGPCEHSYINQKLGSMYYSETHPPDAARRGGMLCNDRGTGKTYIAAALIAKRPAAQEWLSGLDGADLDLSNDGQHDTIANWYTAPACDSEEGGEAPMYTPIIHESRPQVDEYAQALRAWDAVGVQRVPTTLVVVPKSNLLPQWQAELEHLGLRVSMHYGKARVVSVDDLADIDVLLTTSDTLRSAMTRQAVPHGCNERTIFARVRFWRLIVDECHKLITGYALNKSGQALSWVRAYQRWGISATPDVNLSRCRAYLQFLFGVPTHESALTSHIHHFIRYPNRYTAYCIRNAWRVSIFPAVTIREALAEEVLPEVDHVVECIQPSDEWHTRYDDMFRLCQRVVSQTRGPRVNHIFNQLLLAISGCRSMPCPEFEYNAINVDGPEVPPDVVECTICLNQLEEPVVTACNHHFCRSCIRQWRQQDPYKRCPLCRTPLAPRDTPCHYIPNEEPVAAETLGPLMGKINCIVERIVDIVIEDNSHNADPAERAPNRVLCFSRFPDMRRAILDRLDGVVSVTTSVEYFQKNEDCAVLVLSPATCGVGLNLMQANYVILAEPSFRRSTDKQAYGRCARLGQTRKVHVHWYYVNNTVEATLYHCNDSGAVSMKRIFQLE